MKILIFLHGTTIMHKNAVACSREKRVKQVIENEKSVFDYASYVPVGNSVQKLKSWANQGAEIFYLSSHRDIKDVEKDKLVLDKHNFPKGQLLFRKQGEEYKGIAEKIIPNVLIEDDCESIGGEAEMVYPHIRPELKTKIKSIVVKEFEGVDRLPDSAVDLLNYVN